MKKSIPFNPASAFVLVLILAISGFSQGVNTPSFKLTFNPSHLNMPIEIISVDIAGESHDDLSRIPFANGIRGFKIKFKNVSEKSIAFVQITLLITKAGDVPHGFVFHAIDGQYPSVCDPMQKDVRLPIARGQLSVAQVNPKTADSVSLRLSNANVKNIDNVIVDNIRVIFSDQTGWENGRTIYQSKDDPSVWSPQSTDEFAFLPQIIVADDFFFSPDEGACYYKRLQTPNFNVCGAATPEASCIQCAVDLQLHTQDPSDAPGETAGPLGMVFTECYSLQSPNCTCNPEVEGVYSSWVFPTQPCGPTPTLTPTPTPTPTPSPTPDCRDEDGDEH